MTIMRLVRLAVLLAIAAALATPGSGDELTADQIVDRMVAANSAWLKAPVEGLSYVLFERSIPNWEWRVSYRAPNHLRIEGKSVPPAPGDPPRRLWIAGGVPKRLLLVPGGRGFAADFKVEAVERDAAEARDAALSQIVFCGATWALANHRDEVKVSRMRREQVDGRDCHHLLVSQFRRPVLAVEFMAESDYPDESRELWIDAETFRPRREAWFDRLTSPDMRIVVRYGDYRPFPTGGEAPMRLEECTRWPATRPYAAEPQYGPTRVSDYQVLDGKFWCLESVTYPAAASSGNKVSQISLSAPPMSLFYDAELLRRVERAAELYTKFQVYLDGQRWKELYDTCEEIISLGWGRWRAAQAAFPLYFWHGDYEKAIGLIKIIGDRGIYLAWAYDATGLREKALEKYRQVADIPPGPDTPRRTTAKRGLKSPWIPPSRRLRPAKNERLLEASNHWRVKTFVPGLTPEAAIDGDRRTRWVSIEAQRPGMWFQVDLGAPIKLTRIAFDFVGDLTLYYRDYPREYRVEVSVDGERWQTLAKGRGPLDNLLNVAFKPRMVRYVRLHQTGATHQNCWSIHEIFFYAPK